MIKMPGERRKMHSKFLYTSRIFLTPIAAAAPTLPFFAAFLTEYVVDTLSHFFYSFEEISSIVVKVTKDRIADYLYHAGCDTENLTVLFFNIDS